MEAENIHNSHKNNIHQVLIHIYVAYFVFFLVGLSLDIFFRTNFFPEAIMRPVGAVLLVVATYVIFWAQKTGRNLREIKEDLKKEHFCRGPYCYTRIPTQWGLTLLMLGFGIFSNSFFVVLGTVFALLFSQLAFMGKHDRIMIEKFGDSYQEYKKMLKF
jgi:protein-S-isoprenylcysteine O-methyltransferase Ste14